MLEKNRRQFFRIKLDRWLCAAMTVVQIKDRNVNAGNAQVCIVDMGPGGLRFLSNLSLPVSSQVVLEFDLHIVNYDFKLKGIIVRKVDKPRSTAEYGVKFVECSEVTRSSLIKALGIMLIRIQKGAMMNSCRFCMQNAKECWKRAM